MPSLLCKAVNRSDSSNRRVVTKLSAVCDFRVPCCQLSGQCDVQLIDIGKTPVLVSAPGL